MLFAAGLPPVVLRALVVLAGSCSPKGPVWKVPVTKPSALVVANISPWILGREREELPALVLVGRMVTRTPPGRVRYFSVTAPVASVRKSGESPEAV